MFIRARNTNYEQLPARGGFRGGRGSRQGRGGSRGGGNRDKSYPENSQATTCTDHTGVGSISFRRPTAEIGKPTPNGAGTEPSAVKTRSQTTDNDEYPVAATNMNKEPKTKKKGRNRKRKKKKTDNIPGTSSVVEDDGLAPADLRQ